MQDDCLPARSTRPLYPLRGGAPGIADKAGLEETSSDRGREQGGDVDDEDTATNPRVARRPATPTKALIMAHDVHHADYRDWCDHCVAGKGVSHKHTTFDRDSRSDTAEFCLDYAFTTEEGRDGYLEDMGIETMLD